VTPTTRRAPAPDTFEGSAMSERVQATVPRAVTRLLAAATVTVLAAAIAVAAVRWGHRHAGAAQLSAAENAAVSAARQETINIQTYRLASFDADFAAALAGLTPGKRTQWQADKVTLKTQLTQQKISSTATVTGAGLTGLSGDTATVVVSSNTQRVDSTGKTTTTAQNRFQITMKRMNGRWLMDDLQSVSIS
jgi:Mce-associated membrane protein